MMRKTILVVFFLAMIFQGRSFAAEGKSVKLPPPQRENGKPLMQALGERHSSREFSPEEISLQTLSNLLWAANGINRPDGRRTAPSAHNAQEIDIYVAKREALYLYHADTHELTSVAQGDFRSFTGKQSFVKDAPVSLIFVTDLEKLSGDSEQDANFYSNTDTGYISQNVYLYCASEGLATVVLGWIDRDQINTILKLRPRQRVILTQPVGYPKNKK
ncbi:MAG TPA: SagB/ThcOx family dehydrogenase [Candidatus Omnitrophota bacterium]|nr:SagB/ThcOx family dehydrogenase [Candidatus Omnitrophota bacterium]